MQVPGGDNAGPWYLHLDECLLKVRIYLKFMIIFKLFLSHLIEFDISSPTSNSFFNVHHFFRNMVCLLHTPYFGLLGAPNSVTDVHGQRKALRDDPPLDEGFHVNDYFTSLSYNNHSQLLGSLHGLKVDVQGCKPHHAQPHACDSCIRRFTLVCWDNLELGAFR